MVPPKQKLDFWDESIKAAYEQDMLHPILKSFGYHYGDLEEEGFEKVCKLLEFQGWKFISSITFCKNSKGIDPTLVRLFYSNFKYSSSRKLVQTIIKRCHMFFTPKDLEEFLIGLCSFENITTNDGNSVFLSYGCNESTIEGYDSKTSFKELLAPEFYEVSKPTTSHLTRDNRLLTHILYHTIIPHEGSQTSLGNLTLMLLYCLNRKIRVHLPTLIISHMEHAKSISNHRYPYGMLITQFAHEYASVPLAKICDKSFQKYDKARLNNIFYFDEEAQEWIFSPKSNKRPRASSSVSQNPSTSRPSTSSSQFPTSLESDPSLNLPSKWETDFFEKVDSRINKIESFINKKFEIYDDRIVGCEVKIGGYMNEFQNALDKQKEMLEAFGDCLKITHDKLSPRDPYAQYAYQR